MTAPERPAMVLSDTFDDSAPPECAHLWMLIYAHNLTLSAGRRDIGRVEETFFCQRDPTHRLVLVDGKVSG